VPSSEARKEWKINMKKEKSCGCIIIENEKVLLVQEMEGHWGFPKGHVEPGETEAQTAIRETKEETNLNVEVDTNKRYEINYIVREDIDKSVVYFISNIIDGKIKKQETEINNIEWLPFREAMERLTHENARDMFKQVLKDLEIKGF
jgi:8-oxo-dGTP pyrophosphatase MutT (NUDIX family)